MTAIAAACPRCGAVDATGRLSVCPRCLLADLAGGGDGDDAIAPKDLPNDLPKLGAEGLVLEAELGHGGMGRVFRARDQRLGRAVAVKVLRPESAANPDFRARFAREARTLARLEHPGIVAVHDFGTTPDGNGYLVMQLMTGGSIAAKLPLPVGDALAIAIDLCDALAYAHARGIVHRDIKPENVLLGEDGRGRLSDFGIARLVEPTPEDGPLTRPSLVLGTPGYMAPEARAGARPDPRMDVYAVGALLRHMLTGRHPGGADGADTPERASAARIPPAVAAVIARATAVDPAARTADAATLGAELSALAAQFKATPRAAFDLPPEEGVWRGAVALLAAVATAVALYAVLVSLTPRAISADDAIPFTTFGNTPLGNGRVLTRARFEVWPTLGAAVATAIALAAYGLLRRHWRAAGLERPAPDRPLVGARRVLRIGLVIIALFIPSELLRRQGALVASYMPVVGGCLELIMLYRLWDAVLEAKQTSRSLAHEPLLWLGLALALFPPTYNIPQLLTAAGH
ncbi:MAG TPA: serine/threonine-protein kinase [Polyangia bacterium]|nr:serine/threonine-protein kinase [Polyangia bacterium]